MGYQHRVRKATCGNCGKQVAWSWSDGLAAARVWKCNCSSRNYLKPPPDWPDLPRALYIGPEKTRRLKVYALPPEVPNTSWAQPYSVRSFVFQASRNLGGCSYSCQVRGNVMGETVFTDICTDPEEAYDESWDCHLVGGWTSGQTECPLWRNISNLCQTETEEKFLHQYLRFVKDRQFPMLIPQVSIGIAERRRPDFVAFVPL
jgi:DNA-directed RNA polymerase subunit RPC12/RpoP